MDDSVCNRKHLSHNVKEGNAPQVHFVSHQVAHEISEHKSRGEQKQFLLNASIIRNKFVLQQEKRKETTEYQSVWNRYQEALERFRDRGDRYHVGENAEKEH